MSPTPPDPANALARLLDRRLLVFLGKGGVGKSTLAAATARLLAAQGKRVLLAEIHAKDSLPALLGVAPVGPELTAVAWIPNLTLVNIQPEAALHEYAVMKLKVKRVVDRLLGNTVVHHFLRLLPSLSETVVLGKLLFHVKEETDGVPRFDAVVLDAPATGHGLSLLQLPQVLLRSIPAGPLREDMEWMNGLLVDPEITALNLVTLAEELSVNETLELSAALRDQLELPRGICVANALWPRRFGVAELTELAHGSPGLFAMADRLQAQADVNEAQVGRLRAELDLPILELPQLFSAQTAVEVTRGVQALLEAELTRPLGRVATR